MIVPAGFSLTFSLNNDSLDYFSVCEIQVRDKPYSPLDDGAIDWIRVSYADWKHNAMSSATIIDGHLRCPHLLSDNHYNPELRRYLTGYMRGTDCHVGSFDMTVVLAKPTDVDTVVVWIPYRPGCTKSVGELTVILRNSSNSTGVPCQKYTWEMNQDALMGRYMKCYPVRSVRMLTIHLPVDINDIVEVAVLADEQEENGKKSNPEVKVEKSVFQKLFSLEIIIFVMFACSLTFYVQGLVRANRKSNADESVTIDPQVVKALVIPGVECETEKENALVNHVPRRNTLRRNTMPTLKLLHDNKVKVKVNVSLDEDYVRPSVVDLHESL